MIDRFSQMRLRLLYPGFGDLVMEVMNEIQMVSNKELGVIESIRSFKKQEKLYKDGLSEYRAYKSLHNYGLACDLGFKGEDLLLRRLSNMERNQLFDELERIAKRKGLFCHVDADTHLIHLEMEVCSAKLLEEEHKRGGLEGVWTFLDQTRGVPYGSGWIGDYKFYRCIENEGL